MSNKSSLLANYKFEILIAFVVIGILEYTSWHFITKIPQERTTTIEEYLTIESRGNPIDCVLLVDARLGEDYRINIHSYMNKEDKQSSFPECKEQIAEDKENTCISFFEDTVIKGNKGHYGRIDHYWELRQGFCKPKVDRLVAELKLRNYDFYLNEDTLILPYYEFAIGYFSIVKVSTPLEYLDDKYRVIFSTDATHQEKDFQVILDHENAQKFSHELSKKMNTYKVEVKE